MSLYKRLHDMQTAAPAEGGAPAGTLRRDPVIDELRQRIHHTLIDDLGPILYDKRLGEDDLRKKVHDQLHAALAQERAPELRVDGEARWPRHSRAQREVPLRAVSRRQDARGELPHRQ